MRSEITYSVHALSQGLRGAPMAGVQEAREYQRAVGADGGLEVLPIRSPLVTEIFKGARRDDYQNVQDDMPLVGSLQYPFAPTVGQAFQRQRERVSRGELSPLQAFVRFSNNIGQRTLMPAAVNAATRMERLAMGVANPNLFAVMPPEAFTVEEGERVSFAGSSTPYKRVAQISPDLLERLRVDDISELPAALEEVNVNAVSLDLFHLSRKSQTGNTQLPPFRAWLDTLVRQVSVRQIGVSINRMGELPPAVGETAPAETARLGAALLLLGPERKDIGPDLPDLVNTVREAQPEMPLTVTLVGARRQLSVGQVATILANVKEAIG